MWKVLIADDEPFVREGLEKLIAWEELGYQLEGSYKNGQQLIYAVPEKMPDLIILDIKMPLMSGLEAAKIIRQKWPDIVIILLTAYAEFQYAQQAIQYGVRSYVLKSNLLEDLPVTLREMTEQLEQLKFFREKMEEFLKTSESESAEPLSCKELEEVSSVQADDLIQQTSRFVEERLEKKITLDDIADAVHVNRSYLSRIYKQKTGENLFEMINRRRIDRAKEYIHDGNKKIYEIASLVGLEDTAYFSRVFKRYTGYSPKEYENMLEREKRE